MGEGTVQLPPDSTGKVMRTQTNAGVASGAHQPVETLADAAGNLYSSLATDNRRALDVNLAGSQGGNNNVVGTLTGAASTVQAAIGTMGNGSIMLSGGTYTNLQIAFEASIDGGTNWFPIDVVRSDGSVVVYGETFTGAVVRVWNYMAPGYSHVRARAVAQTSTVNPTITITQGPFLYDPSPSVVPVDGNKATYAASVSGYSDINALDMMRLIGSATKTIRVTRIDWSVATGAAWNAGRLTVVKRTTAGTPGTASTAPTIAPYDSRDPAATATAATYSTAGTPGTAGAIVASSPVYAPGAQMLSGTFEFGHRPAKCPVIRGTAESLNIVLAAGGATSGVWNFVMEFTEEDP